MAFSTSCYQQEAVLRLIQKIQQTLTMAGLSVGDLELPAPILIPWLALRAPDPHTHTSCASSHLSLFSSASRLLMIWTKFWK